MVKIGELGFGSYPQKISCTGGRRVPVPLIQESDHDHVQASLSSTYAVDGNSRKSDATPSLLQLFPAVDVENLVDTTLSLSLPGKRPTITLAKCNSDDQDQDQDQDQVDDTTLSLSLPSKKRGRGDNASDEISKPRKIIFDDENQQPSVPKEENPGLFQTLESRGGSGPVFLYRKKLEESDVKKGQNRLLVTRGGRVMEFLREEEAAAVVGGGKGIKLLGVDGGGRVYEKMGLTKWSSLNKLVINLDWGELVIQNNARKGDIVEIWGYRENQNPCLAFNFRREGGDIV